MGKRKVKDEKLMLKNSCVLQRNSQRAEEAAASSSERILSHLMEN
jgi:hypothetical protein